MLLRAQRSLNQTSDEESQSICIIHRRKKSYHHKFVKGQKNHLKVPPDFSDLEHSRSRKQPRESGCEALLHSAPHQQCKDMLATARREILCNAMSFTQLAKILPTPLQTPHPHAHSHTQPLPSTNLSFRPR